MRVRACEFVFGLLSEGIVPDNPVSHDKAELVGDDFNVCCEFIANSDVKRTVRFEHFFAGGHPFFCPGNILFAFLFVIVFVIFGADIERRICKDEVCEGLFDFEKHAIDPRPLLSEKGLIEGHTVKKKEEVECGA